eukprot:TRINITY_DN63906_c0_g1_i1.p1 TRINITY_DN63906_c0_g1~~TRINITY_DN63906_c0_g1_i1.p1  ORF type:complete len:374 (-),score=73.46 TRINITY_DN63906_c0_g1_i1:71-1192(-)
MYGGQGGVPMGGPMAGYPPGGFGEYGSQPLTKEQKKEQERMERREQRARMIEKQEKQNKTNASSFVMTMSLLLSGTSLLLGIPLFGNSWGHKQFTGLGVSVFTMRTSMFNLEVDIKCKKNFIESRLCKAAEPLKGVHSLHEAQGNACALNGAMCDIMSRYYVGSFIIFTAFSLSILLNLIGSFFHYAYWFVSPLPRLKYFAWGTIVSSPLVALGGVIAWTLYVPNLADLPNAWTSHSKMLMGSDLFSYKEVHTMNYGWCWIFSLAAIFFMLMQVLTWFCFFSTHEGEEEAVEEEERQNDYLAAVASDPSMALAMEQQRQQQAALPPAQPGYPPLGNQMGQPMMAGGDATWGGQPQPMLGVPQDFAPQPQFGGN